MKIHEIIMELGDSPLKYKIIDDDGQTFIASAGNIEVEFFAFSSGRAELNFDVGGSMTITGKGDAFKIFSTVGKIMSDNLVQFLARNSNVKTVYFTAEESSRIKLYDKFVPYISKILGSGWIYKRNVFKNDGVRYDWYKQS